jgi:hypothetical protein
MLLDISANTHVGIPRRVVNVRNVREISYDICGRVYFQYGPGEYTCFVVLPERVEAAFGELILALSSGRDVDAIDLRPYQVKDTVEVPS